jgi:pimeloyl-ACP methyl ester carboxylesterase
VHSGFVKAAGRTLEYQLIPAHQINRPTLVLLHEGLGSVAMWRDFPARLATATGCRTLVYSRYGYGQSDLLQEPFGTDYMHREAHETLPEALAALQHRKPGAGRPFRRRLDLHCCMPVPGIRWRAWW